MRPPTDPGTCPGCGLELPQLHTPTPTDLGASAACWALYSQLLVHEYSLAVSRRVHRLTLSAYAAQHPATSAHQPINQMSLHLIELCLLLDHSRPAHQATKLLATVLEQPAGLRWLEPPMPNGTVTVSDVLAARTRDAHELVVERWARSVWNAWRPHHATVRAWIERGLGTAHIPQ
jgi:hypothetical protein